MTAIRKLAIIGVGPRGGYALERLIKELVEQNKLFNIQISLFEATSNFGNGQIYDTKQVLSNWINITERILELEERQRIQNKGLQINSFPSYHQWIQRDYKSIAKVEFDIYPPRAKVGQYLFKRFQSLIDPLIKSKIVTLHKELVKEIRFIDHEKLELWVDEHSHEVFDEVLLTIGHQPTKLSKQISDWENYASGHNNLDLFKSAYPVKDYLHSKNLNNESIIAIRGFGLAMIDVARAIAERFGSFVIKDKHNRACAYQIEQEIKTIIIPFSLDGLPPAPKPLNAKIDETFKVSALSISIFEKEIGNKKIQKEAKSPDFLIKSFARIAVDIYSDLAKDNKLQVPSNQELEKLICRWLKDQNIEHTLFTPLKQAAEKSMRDFVAMATGYLPPSLDYCIGQVWRHCQPTIYKALSYNKCSDQVFAEIIKLDESTKRYSYGPPVESIQQLLALLDAGFLNLDLVDDPDIELANQGWSLEKLSNQIIATIMIDSVVDAPKIKSVSSSIVKQLLADDLMNVVHDDLGVATDEYGYLKLKDKKNKIPIALLGRLAKGTVIGVDAILECFGSRPREWAKQAANNHIDWLDKK